MKVVVKIDMSASSVARSASVEYEGPDGNTVALCNWAIRAVADEAIRVFQMPAPKADEKEGA